MKNEADDKLSKLANARSWFEELRQVDEFDQRQTELAGMIGANLLFNRGEAKWLLEAWILKKFARFVDASQIRLNRPDPPDGYAIFESSTVPMEMTEVLEPGRKRGLEYRKSKPELEFDPGEDWLRRAESIPEALRQRISAKLSGRYSAETELVVYLNIGEYGIRQRQVENLIVSLLKNSLGPFVAIHIMWKEKLFSSSGETRSLAASNLMDESDDGEVFRHALNS